MEINNKYEGTIKIQAENKLISASLKVDYVIKGERTSSLNFYLPPETSNIEIVADQVKTTNISTEAKWPNLIYGDTKITLELNKTFDPGDVITILFKYTSHLSNMPDTGMNMFSEEVIEIGVYVPWFPLTENLEQAIFNVAVEINQDYIVAGGNTRNENGAWVLDNKIPYICCTILASKNFRNNCFANAVGNLSTNVYWVDENNRELALYISESINGIMEFYVNTFGQVEGEKIDVVIVPRDETESSGGYCRTGLIVLPGGGGDNGKARDKDYMFKYLAHELAHTWWNKADVSTWENWLNESFAEYSSLMAVRELSSQEKFLKTLELNKAKTVGMESIRDCNFKDEDYFDIWYKKGPVILNDLESKIGLLRFKDLLKTIHCEKLRETNDILNRIKAMEGDKVGEYLSSLISE